MATAKNTEIGRVSVRVSPDTTGFRRDLKTQLEKATAGVDAKVGIAFDSTGIRTRLKAELEKATAGLAAKVKIDSDSTGIGAGLDSANKKLKEAVKNATTFRDIFRQVRDAVDRVAIVREISSLRDLAAELRSISSSTRQLFSSEGRMRKWFSNLRDGADGSDGALTRLRRGLDTVKDAVSNAFRVLAGLAGAAVSVLGSLLKIGGVAAVIAVAGAGITAAWGAVSTAIAAVPAALALAAAPIAAVALGLDGIKAAAKTLSPEVDRLKASLSQTFQTGLTPAFKQLKALFPTIQTGLNGIAQAMSGVAVDLAKFVTQGPQVDPLSRSFENIKTAVGDLGFGIQDITDGFLQITALREPFDVLTGVVQTFGAQFKLSVSDLIADGTLQSAFKGLGGVLDEATRGFVRLVNNGIRAFSSAAPGVKDFLRSLTNFFDRFDWERLGGAVGDVFGGLGEALDKIPQSTIDNITVAFEKLGDLFRDPVFQQKIADIVAGLPAAIDTVRVYADVFVNTVRNISTAAKNLQEHGWKAFFLPDGLFTGAAASLDSQVSQFTGTAIPAAGEKIRLATEVAGRKGFGSLVQTADVELGKMLPVLDKNLGSIPGTVASGLAPLPGVVGQEIGKLPGVVNSGFGSMVGAVGAGTTRMTGSLRTDMSGFAQAGEQGANTAGQKITAGVNRAQSDVRNTNSGWSSVGGYLMRGLSSGIAGNTGIIITAAINAARAAYNAAKRWLGIASPSKVFAKLGKFTVQGFAVGFENNTKIVIGSVRDMVGSIVKATAGLSDAFDGKSLGDSWTNSIENRIPSAIKSAERLMNGSVTAGLSATVTSDGFGTIEDKVSKAVGSALTGWALELSPQGVARLSNKGNTRNARR